MKINLEQTHSTFIVTSPDEDLRAEIDIETGTVELTYIVVSIDRLHAFTHTARSLYRKFLTTKSVEDFLE